MCPTRALLAYLQRTLSLPATAPLFALPTAGRWDAVPYAWMLQRLKTAMAAAGLDAANYAAHSFRRGGATFAYLAGLDDQMIMALGDWKSPVWREYVEVQTAQRAAASQRLAAASGLVLGLAGPPTQPPQ